MPPNALGYTAPPDDDARRPLANASANLPSVQGFVKEMEHTNRLLPIP